MQNKCWDFIRFSSHRFDFDVANYVGDDMDRTSMKHVRIHCKGAMQVDLWFNPTDVCTLTDALKWEEVNKK